MALQDPPISSLPRRGTLARGRSPVAETAAQGSPSQTAQEFASQAAQGFAHQAARRDRLLGWILWGTLAALVLVLSR